MKPQITVIASLVIILFALSGYRFSQESLSGETEDQSQISPRIAFVNVNNGQSLIYTIDLDGENFEQVTSETSQFASETDPNWSADGTQIYFGSASGDAIYRVSTLGNTEPILIWASSIPIGTLRLSPDGNQFAFFTRIDDETAGIYTLNVDGSNLQEIARFSCHCGPFAHFSWSPDGEQIIFPAHNGYARIGIIDIDTTALSYVTSPTISAFLPSWSPDGLQFAFISSVDSEESLIVANADGSSPQNMTNETLEISFQPVWSPDGQLIAITDGFSLYVVRISDGALTEVMSLREYIHLPEAETRVASITNSNITRVEWLATGNGIAFSAQIYGTLDGGAPYYEAQLGWVDIACIQLSHECSEEDVSRIISLEGEIRDIALYPNVYHEN